MHGHWRSTPLTQIPLRGVNFRIQTFWRVSKSDMVHIHFTFYLTPFKSGAAPRIQIHYYFYSKICEYAHQVDLKKLLKDSSSDQVLPPNWIQKYVHFQNFLWSQYYRHELWTCTSSSITSYIIPQRVLTRVDLFFPYVEGNMQTV